MKNLTIFLLIFIIAIGCGDSKKEKLRFETKELKGAVEKFDNIDILSRGYNKFSFRLIEPVDSTNMTVSFFYYKNKDSIRIENFYPSKEKFLRTFEEREIDFSGKVPFSSEKALKTVILEMMIYLESLNMISTTREFESLGISRVFYLANNTGEIYFIADTTKVVNEEWQEAISKSKKLGEGFYHYFHK